MLSKRARYAIKTLIYIYKNEGSSHVTAKSISDTERIPFKFLEQILRELRQHKIVKSKRGAVGGYRFLKPPNTVKVMDLIRIIDGPIALIPCVSENFYEKCDECIDEDTCKIRQLFAELRDQMLPVLERTIEDLSKA
jgi:Rrf2 family protein